MHDLLKMFGPPEKPRDILVNLANEATLWSNHDFEGFATIQVGDHYENHPIRSRRFRLWLSSRYYNEQKAAAPKQAFNDAVSTLEAKAVHSGAQHEVNLRIAEHQGTIYVDLADENWRVVRITAKGWKVIDNPPVRFIRTPGMRPLPTPRRGGSVGDLKQFLNVRTEADFRLVVGWLLAAFRPGKPFPVLVLGGEQGTGKSTISRLLRCLVDPNSAPIRSVPREERDLVAAARNGWMICLDNLSRLPPWLSDALCRLSTGGGLGGRQLYSDHTEAVFDAYRPCLINAIPDIVGRPDLTDRAVVLKFSPIPAENRLPESEFQAAFEVFWPKIFGALLDGVSCALHRVSIIKLDHTPRMADFARWVVSAEEALGWPAGAFLADYVENRAIALQTSIEGEPVAIAVKDLIHTHGHWQGTPTELLHVLTPYASAAKVASRFWPQAANALTNRLRRVAPALRQIGIDFEDFRVGRDRTRMIKLTKAPEKTVHTVRQAGTSAEIKEFPTDDQRAVQVNRPSVPGR